MNKQYSSAEMLAAHNDLNHQNYMAMMSQLSDERISGYPQPQLYDQHYINKYAYPKGLKCSGRREDREVNQKRSLYDMRVPQNRKGFSGWKLTKRPQQGPVESSNSMLDLGLSGSGYSGGGRKKRGKRKMDPYMPVDPYQMG